MKNNVAWGLALPAVLVALSGCAASGVDNQSVVDETSQASAPVEDLNENSATPVAVLSREEACDVIAGPSGDYILEQYVVLLGDIAAADAEEFNENVIHDVNDVHGRIVETLDSSPASLHPTLADLNSPLEEIVDVYRAGGGDLGIDLEGMKDAVTDAMLECLDDEEELATVAETVLAEVERAVAAGGGAAQAEEPEAVNLELQYSSFEEWLTDYADEVGVHSVGSSLCAAVLPSSGDVSESLGVRTASLIADTIDAGPGRASMGMDLTGLSVEVQQIYDSSTEQVKPLVAPLLEGVNRARARLDATSAELADGLELMKDGALIVTLECATKDHDALGGIVGAMEDELSAAGL